MPKVTISPCNAASYAIFTAAWNAGRSAMTWSAGMAIMTGSCPSPAACNAAIVNAQKILELKKDFGSFKGWIDAHHPLTKEEWIKLFKKTFKFTGGEIVNEFLMSTGYLPGAHDADCPIYKKVKLIEATQKA